MSVKAAKKSAGRLTERSGENRRNFRPLRIGRGTRLFGLCLGLLPIAGTGQVAPAAFQKGPIAYLAGVKLPQTLPCFTWRGLPLLDGSINNKPMRCVVDTGLNALTVSPTVRGALNLPASKRIYHVSVMENTLDAPGVTVKAMSLGAIVFSNADAPVVNVAGLLSAQTPPDTPQCWLGTPLLSAFQITIDMEHSTVTFDSPKAALPAPDDAITLPLLLRNGRIFTRLTIPGGRPFLMLIDTGSPATILPLTAFDKLKIKPFKTQVVVLANRRKARAAQIVLPALSLGGATLKNLPVVSIASENPKDFDPDFGLIGMDILSRYRIVINYARLKMVLIPNTPAPEKAADAPPKSP